jgi:hypothetical protein
MTAHRRPRPAKRTEDRRAVRYEALELRVDPQPVRPFCPYCGDEIFPGEYRDPISGRCVHCVGRGGSALGWIAVLAFVVTVALAIVLVGWIAAPRSAAQVPTVAGDGGGDRLEQLTGAPRPTVWRTARAEQSGSYDPRPRAGAPVPQLDGGISTALVTGTVTWYCSDGRDGSRRSDCTAGYGPDDRVAAIARGLGFAKGDVVTVRYNGREVDVRIVDVCRCPDPRVIDLTIGAFQELAPWGLGVLHGAELEGASGPRVTLPPTDTAPWGAGS